jgi:hypothetical protein
VVGLFLASGNTLYWVIVVGLCEVSDSIFKILAIIGVRPSATGLFSVLGDMYFDATMTMSAGGRVC